MSRFHLVPETNVSPSHCVLCNGIGGPFVDTGVELPMYGRLWICASNGKRVGCARQIGRADGMIAPELMQVRDEQLIEMNERLRELEDVIKETEVTHTLGELMGLVGP